MSKIVKRLKLFPIIKIESIKDFTICLSISKNKKNKEINKIELKEDSSSNDITEISNSDDIENSNKDLKNKKPNSGRTNSYKKEN